MPDDGPSGYTRHGHPYGPNPPARDYLAGIARCGGIKVCLACRDEVQGMREAAAAGREASAAALKVALGDAAHPAAQAVLAHMHPLLPVPHSSRCEAMTSIGRYVGDPCRCRERYADELTAVVLRWAAQDIEQHAHLAHDPHSVRCVAEALAAEADDIERAHRD